MVTLFKYRLQELSLSDTLLLAYFITLVIAISVGVLKELVGDIPLGGEEQCIEGYKYKVIDTKVYKAMDTQGQYIKCK